MPHRSLTPNQQALIKRYFVWCYKTTKESLDRIDRYYTQLMADDFMLKQLRKAKAVSKEAQKGYDAAVCDFEKYMNTKKSNVDQQKFLDSSRGILKPDYVYLQNRMKALEKAIVHFLGKRELKDIQLLYEREMTLRILQARDHS